MNASKFSSFWVSVIAAVGFFCATGILPAQAGDPTEQQIIQALKPKVTRGLTLATGDRTRATEEQNFIDSLRSSGATRSLSTKERERVATIAQERPKIDLEINFGFNSDQLTSKGMASAETLGRALTSPDMKGVTVLVAGHTDAKGSADYNQDLSERRAASVKRFLIDKFSIPAENLVTAGYGKEKLKNASAPYAAENRRVEVVNLSAQASAQNNR
jgi:outer membrane protein OmpA-like peptidoglycan-associated protein